MHQDKLISALKARRDSLRLTQESLAEMSGVNLRTLKQFESGKGNPTLVTLQKLADHKNDNQEVIKTYNMLSEGVNRQLQSRHLQIDENDHFGMLLATGQKDTIGAIEIKPGKS